jgi:predicted ATPase/class 3 adenylate cyclase
VQRPTGTVTLLFTDVVGSTAAWEREPDAMAAAVARHDELLREAVEQLGGVVFKTMGDAVCAAFGDAPSALGAAAAAARAIAGEPWMTAEPLSVRMALNTGACEERNRDYFGPTVNRVARLVAITNGGQILCARATADLAADALPSGSTLRSLGQHRLRDLAREEEVFQLDVEGLAVAFPPLKSLSNPALRHNLPVQLTSFIGREAEVEKVCELVGGHRLVTITGPGGCGKTRLGLQVAANLIDGSGGGVWFVDLAPLRAQSEVASAVAQVLDVREAPPEPIQESIARSIVGKRVLVLLDNCEHLIESTVAIADFLLHRCEQLFILATSREPLGVDGEQLFRIPPMTLSATHDSSDVPVHQSEAVELFCERARTHDPGFHLDGDAARHVVAVCQRLDGIPLAIELAASRTRSFSVAEVERRLSDRFTLLTGSSRTAMPRQRTIEATIDWSWELLGEAERAALACLSVFVGPFSLEAAVAVVGDIKMTEPEVADAVAALVDRSLVQVEALGSDRRYRLLETIRDYATKKLADDPSNLQAARGRYLSYFTEMWGIPLALPSRTVDDDAALVRRGHEQRDDLDAIARMLLQRGALDGKEFNLVVHCATILYTLGIESSGNELLRGALSAAGESCLVTDVAFALERMAVHDFVGGHADEARAHLEAATDLAMESDDLFLRTFVLRTACAIARHGDEQALSRAIDGLTEIIQSNCDEVTRSLARSWRAVYVWSDDPEQSISDFRAGLATMATNKSPSEYMFRESYVMLLFQLGQSSEALDLMAREDEFYALDIYAKMTNLSNLSMAKAVAGRVEESVRHCLELFALREQFHGVYQHVVWLETGACVLEACEFHEDAARVYGALERALETASIRLDKFDQWVRERASERLRDALGAELLGVLSDEGMSLSTVDAESLIVSRLNAHVQGSAADAAPSPG